MTDRTLEQTDSGPSGACGAVLSMSLCVAMLIASEFMPVSLLTPMAKGLGVTTGQTGQAILISGLFAVATSLAITTIAGRINRKTVLVVLTGLMLASLIVVAMAPSFALLMAGRALSGDLRRRVLVAGDLDPHAAGAGVRRAARAWLDVWRTGECSGLCRAAWQLPW